MEDETAWPKFHLPVDLWSGILSRLPVKSLLRFRCVSKSWLALISDPDFVRLHLKNFKNNHQETHILVVEGNHQDCHVLCLDDTFQTEAATLAKHGKYDVLFAVDGLVLLAIWFTNLPGLGHVIVSNPSIRKWHEILPEPEDSGCFSVEIGLGYDPLVKDYKLVKLVFESVVRVAIYTLGAGSWKSIQFQGKGCSWHWVSYCIATKKVYLQGSLYFIARDLDTSVWELLSFDLSEEVFSSTSLPDCPSFRSRVFFGWLSLADGGSSLGVISFEPSSSSLWVLESSGDESESVCWTKRYSFSVAVTEFLHITNKGGALIRQCVQDTSADAKDGFNRLISYNLETEEEKILLQIESDQVLNIYGFYDYVESLIMLD